MRAGTAFEEYRQGVPGAIDTLVRLVSPLLWHTARQCGLTAAEAEDVVQQTFLSLVRSKDSVSDPLAVVRWLTVSLRRLAWRERSNSAKRSNEEPTDDDLPRAPSAEHTAVLTDQQRRLWEVVGELNERCRRAAGGDRIRTTARLRRHRGGSGNTGGIHRSNKRALLGQAARSTRRGRLDMTVMRGNAANSADDGFGAELRSELRRTTWTRRAPRWTARTCAS